MTIKINTWIEIYQHDFKDDSAGSGFTLIKLKKFNYNGKPINGIKIKNEDRAKFKDFIPIFDQPSSHSRRAMKIELDEAKVSNLADSSCLEIKKDGIKSIEKWELPTEFRFNGITGMGDARDGILRLNVVEKDIGQGPVTYFSPKVNYIEMPIDKSKVGDYDLYFNNAEHRFEEHTYGTAEGKNSEVVVTNIEWEAHGGGENVTLVDGKLVIGSNAQKGVMPKIQMMFESKNYPHPDAKQASRSEAVRKRVKNAIDRAMACKEGDRKLFEWGWKGNKENFREAVLAMNDLIKLAKHGSKDEKEEYKTYLAWQNDGSENDFSYLKGVIQHTAEVQKWKYDLDKPEEINWNSTNQQENQDKGNENAKNNNEEVKDKVEQDVAEKNKEQSTKLNNTLQGFSGHQTEEEREQSLKVIEASKNKGKSYEEQKEQIDEKKNELAKADPVGYGKMISRVIKQKMEEFKIQIDKLGEEIKTKFNKLKNGEVASDTEVRQIEEEISEKVSTEVANIEVNNLLTRVQNLLNGAADKLKNQLEEVRKSLWSLKISTNPYQQKAYQLQEIKVEKALKDLENFSQNNSQQPSKGFLSSEVIIPTCLVLMIAAVVTALIIRKRKLVKAKK